MGIVVEDSEAKIRSEGEKEGDERKRGMRVNGEERKSLRLKKETN